jgi:hypothetical protein
MTAKPTMPSPPGEHDSTNRANAAAPADLPAMPAMPATSGLARMSEAPGAPETPARRPYEAPRILFREPLEAMAAICTPHPPAKGNKAVCPMGPISS